MKICIIAEGSYPFVTGGVSSWIHTLLKQLPEHQFIIYAIGAQASNRGNYKYELPENVVEVKEVFLDQHIYEAQPRWGRKVAFDQDAIQAFMALLTSNQDMNWNQLFKVLDRMKDHSPIEFLMSRTFYDILESLAYHSFSQVPFTDLYWTVRSMLLPFILLIQEPLPKADIYHSVSTGYAGLLGAYGKYTYNKPFYLTEHGIYSREREEEIIKSDWVKGYFKDIWIDYFYTLSRCAYTFADQVITLFGRNREIQMELGCPEHKIRIVPNGVEISDFYDLPAKQEEEKNQIMIGAFIRVVPIKDIKTMLQSFAIVQREVPEAVFYIMGSYEEDPKYYEECLQLAKTLDLINVYFTGQIDIKQYMNRMDILVLTSISEGQPLVLLEGMAAKKPFVTTDVGSCKELLYGPDDSFGQAGIVCPVMHYEELGHAIIELSKNPSLRQSYGNNGYNRVRAKYTLSLFISSYRKLYSDSEVS